MAQLNDSDQYENGKSIFVFICNHHFGNLENDETFSGRYREGAILDATKLACAIKGSFYIEYIEHHDKTAEEIREIIQTVKDKVNNEEYHSLFLCISSHGESNKVFGTDEKAVNIEQEIINPLHNNQCPGLEGRPKIFFMNACRGSTNPDYVPRDSVKIDDASSMFEIISPIKELSVYSKVGDYMVVYSTPNDFSSLRYPKEGSPLIQTLSNEIIRLSEEPNCKRTTLQHLIESVKQKVYQQYTLVLVVENALVKDLYLPFKGNLFMP